MTRTAKWILISATAVTVLGLVVFGIALALTGGDFTKFNTANYVTNTHVLSAEFDKISVDVNDADVILVPYDGEECRVVCYEEEKYLHKAEVINSTLIISKTDTKKWYDNIGFFFGRLKVTVYLPARTYTSLTVNSNTADLDVPSAFTFSNAKIVTDTGDVRYFASTTGTLDILVDTGDVTVNTPTPRSVRIVTDTGDVKLISLSGCESVFIETDTGEIEIAGVKCTSLAIDAESGDIELIDASCTTLRIEADTADVSLEKVRATEVYIETDTGDVELEGCDAEAFFIKTDTGDVEGSVLTGKIFQISQTSGRVRVPASTAGGVFNVQTDTGDVEIRIGVGDD